MWNKKPIVSILIPCYNAEQWIAETIESALNQTYPHKEIIVVDDGSTDGSLEIIKTFSHRIRWETGSNRGGNIARNRLLELSTGEWLQYLDADDYLLPNKVENQVNFISTVPDADIIWSPGILEYYDGNTFRREPGPVYQQRDPWSLLARWHLPQTGRVLWRKKAILDVGGWNVKQPCCQEHELYLRLLMAGKYFGYLEDPSSVYRLWSGSTVSQKNKSATYKYRLKIIEKIEHYLELVGELNQSRKDAINQSRFDCARMIWLFNRDWANAIIATIRCKDPAFTPSGKAVPLSYRLIYSFLGFNSAENIAKLKRKLFVLFN
jgi:glycosyltransferase involved in cell wall biosynthesis